MADYTVWGRGAGYLDPSFNKGRTASHEIGHFFNLFHIWGDDGGACSGSDFDGTLSWDDTPNQAIETTGNPDPSGIGTEVTDVCTLLTPGIMYQNYMDYCDDVALVMFTKGQWLRMEQAMLFAPDRKNIFSSTTYNPPPAFTYDAGISDILNPVNNSVICAGSAITPTIKLFNFATTTLTNVAIYVQVNGGPASLVQGWTGSLAQYGSVNLTMPSVTLTAGSNTIRYYTTQPNGVADQNTANDFVITTVNYTPTVLGSLPINQGFESTFPATNWTIVNPDNDLTWQKVTGAAKTGSASIRVNNYLYNGGEGQVDYLKLPTLNISSALYNEAYFTFHYAYQQYDPDEIFNDSLEAVISIDCGNNWISLWRKGGLSLATVSGYKTSSTFLPTSSQWSTTAASANITSYRNQDIVLALRHKSAWGQAVYVDDVAITTVANPLPSKLLSFEGAKTGRYNNNLLWKTASQINTDFFALERSSNGVEFTTISNVKAAGNSTDVNSYSVNDNNFTPGLNYYRLKMVDKDGKFEYSKTIAIKDADKATDISIYPNPVETSLNVKIISIVSEKLQLKVTDMQGRVITTSILNVNAGMNSASIETSNLPKGNYLLTVSGVETRTMKFIKY